jgi:predicted nucleotidyltransferase
MPKAARELNIYRTQEVAKALGDLVNEVVFVGGCTTALLVDEAGADFVRQTDDVDIIVDILSRGAMYSFNEKLRERGFSEDASEDAVICRWVIPYFSGKLKVDIMPTDPELLGFSNRWYKDAIKYAQKKTLPDGQIIRLVSPPYFLATKFEAWLDRGKGDYFSHDMEDIIYLIEHREKLRDDLMGATPDIKLYLAEKFHALARDPDFENTLPGLVNDSASINHVSNFITLMSRVMINSR